MPRCKCRYYVTLLPCKQFHLGEGKGEGAQLLQGPPLRTASVWPMYPRHLAVHRGTLQSPKMPELRMTDKGYLLMSSRMQDCQIRFSSIDSCKIEQSFLEIINIKKCPSQRVQLRLRKGPCLKRAFIYRFVCYRNVIFKSVLIFSAAMRVGSIAKRCHVIVATSDGHDRVTDQLCQ